MKYYPHHIGDFVRDTSRLSDSQCMAYLRLIWLYYETEEALPDDTERLAFQIGSDEKTIELLLHCFFYANAKRWHHKRIDSELQAYKDKSKKASESAKARWKNAKTMRPHSEGNANQEPITKNQDKKTTPKPPSPKSARDERFQSEFDDVWMLYPPRKGASRANSLKAYTARRKEGHAAEQIKQGVLAYARYVDVCKTEDQFIKQPETFFGPGLHFQSDWTPPKPRAIANAPNPSARIDAGMEAVQRAKALLFGGEDED